MARGRVFRSGRGWRFGFLRLGMVSSLNTKQPSNLQAAAATSKRDVRVAILLGLQIGWVSSWFHVSAKKTPRAGAMYNGK
jgi:hypothetical protein